MVSLLHEVGSLCTRSCPFPSSPLHCVNFGSAIPLCVSEQKGTFRNTMNYDIVSHLSLPFYCPNSVVVVVVDFGIPIHSLSLSGIVSVQHLKATAVVGWKFAAGIERQSKWHGQEKTKELSPFLPVHNTRIQTTAIHITVYRCMFPSSSLHY